jgi:uncharacterized protein (DUF362 family)/NAD-dependent dihydropyrimidine dehydrogenase PreA subunit
MSTVSVSKCSSYDSSEVQRVISECLGALGGLGSFVKQGQTVLLKPNLLGSRPPQAAVTTHPAIVEAVAREVLALGAKPVIGDSPPFQGQNPRRYESLCKVTGIREVADRLGIEIVSMDDPWRQVEAGGEFYRELPVGSAFLDADVVINLPKLKTHGLTGFSGAIKNMFGCIPGLKKSQLHLQAREDREIFSEMLVDVFATCRPTLNVMDGIVGMEGSGPSKGKPRGVGVVMAGSDAVALDSIACEIVDFRPSSIAHIRIAGERGLGESSLDKIEIVGEELTEVRTRDFLPSPTVGSGLAGMPAPLYRLVKNQFIPMPRIDRRKCVGCGDCVTVCPVKTISLIPRPKLPRERVADVNLQNCIACYCCDEACSYSAIRIHKGRLGELIRRTKRGSEQ